MAMTQTVNPPNSSKKSVVSRCLIRPSANRSDEIADEIDTELQNNTEIRKVFQEAKDDTIIADISEQQPLAIVCGAIHSKQWKYCWNT
jgi:predicted AlkP superfamily phosphohydrolase/phosphomutase